MSEPPPSIDESCQPNGARVGSPMTEPSDVRFSIRALFLLMIGVAVAAAALGPYFRGLDPDERMPVALQWGGSGLLVLCLVVYRARVRYELERQAGAKILLLDPQGQWIRPHRPWVTIMLGCLWIAVGIYYLLAPSIDAMFSRLMRSVISSFVVSVGIATMWWNQEVQLRVHGVLHGLRLLPWSHITARHWNDGELVIEGVDQQHRDTRFKAHVRTDDREVVEELLSARIYDRQLPAPATVLTEKAVALPPVRISPEQNVTARGCLAGFALYIGFIATIIFQPWGRPATGFTTGLLLGVFATVILTACRRRQVSAAGPLLVRMSAFIDWPCLIVAVLMAVGAYLVSRYVPHANPFINGIGGVVCGLGASAAFRMIFFERFDLCENGIVLMWTTYWPWNAIQLSIWNPEGNGRLMFKSGWRRLATSVPEDKRTAVDAVINEKIATRA